MTKPESTVSYTSRSGSKAEAINLVLSSSHRPLTIDEIRAEISKRGLPQRRTKRATLRHLKDLCKIHKLAECEGNQYVWIGPAVETGPWLGRDEAENETQETDQYTLEDNDRRTISWRQIRARRGQQEFRHKLLRRYGACCQVTGCPIQSILEAAHISPYRGDNDHHLDNGLILRADIHTLFDLDLLGINPKSLEIRLHPDVAKVYPGIDGKCLSTPSDRTRRPDLRALELRYRLFERGLSRSP